jgi:hypothetical protein
VLKPGGRVSVSDIALLKPLPDEVRASAAALIGCVAGAELVEETQKMVADAGLVDVTIEKDDAYGEAATDFKDPLYQGILETLPEGQELGDLIVSMGLTAHKPQ